MSRPTRACSSSASSSSSSPPTTTIRKRTRSVSPSPAPRRTRSLGFELIIEKSSRRTRSLITTPTKGSLATLPKKEGVMKRVKRGKENVPPGDELEIDSEEDEDSIMAVAAATLPTPISTPTKVLSRASSSESPITTPSRPRLIKNIFSHAHSLLSTTSSSTSSRPFIGRETQHAALLDFLSSRFPEVYISTSHSSSHSSVPPSLYISGPPGLGKTALLSSVLTSFGNLIEEEGLGDSVRMYMTNCSSLGSVGIERGIWERLGQGLGLNFKVGKGGREVFEAALSRDGGKFLLILDEIDHILTSTTPSSSSRDLLNTLFALAHAPNSNLTLIGIANALDLTTRSIQLPTFTGSKKGKGKSEQSGPMLLPFPPYGAEIIVKIVQQRLGFLSDSYPILDSPEDLTLSETMEGGNEGALLHPMALLFCAKKVALGTGDIRTALEVVRNAIGIVESEERRALLIPTSSLPPSPPSTPTKKSSSQSTTSDSTNDSISNLTPTTTRKVSMSEMLLALRAAGLATPNPLASRLSDLPFNIRNVLVGIVVALSRASTPTSSITYAHKYSPSKSPKSSPPAKSPKVNSLLTTSIRLNVAYEVYLIVLKKEGTLSKFLSKSEFQSSLDLLESTAFITIESFATGSSPSKGGKRGAPSKSKTNRDLSADPVIRLSESIVSLKEVMDALKETPARHCEIEEESLLSPSTTSSRAPNKKFASLSRVTVGAGAMQETLRISRWIIREEEERITRLKRRAGEAQGEEKRKEELEREAPREGFHGGGLMREEVGHYLGEKRRRLE